MWKYQENTEENLSKMENNKKKLYTCCENNLETLF